MTILLIAGALVVAALIAIAIYDLTQRKRAILRNFPIIGHLRYILEKVGPELRQYIVTDNDEERPFTRDQRRWVYASSKRENQYFGFGTDNELDSPPPGYVIVKHSPFPLDHRADAEDLDASLPSRKILGERHDRRHAFRPASIVNISGMSFGSLSGPAVEALNRGAAIAGCLQNTGEGGLSVHHQHGGELVFQMGTGYFGCRDQAGRFSMEALAELTAENPVRAIEIKLSQGAKPGIGGLLPAAKVSREIAVTRGIAVGEDCKSPSRHAEFDSVDSMLDFIERVADRTGLPVGIKSAVGEDDFWAELARRMDETGTGPDYINIDGGEGGTGAGPLAFTDHVALPFKIAFSRVFRAFAERGITEEVTFVGAGKLGFPDAALLAMALGCDLISVGREAMLSVGCIQAQRCHTGHCPTGVATQSRRLARGLDAPSKAERCASYIRTLRAELGQLANACGFEHPADVGLDRLEILSDRYQSTPAREVFGYGPEDGR